MLRQAIQLEETLEAKSAAYEKTVVTNTNLREDLRVLEEDLLHVSSENTQLRVSSGRILPYGCVQSTCANCWVRCPEHAYHFLSAVSSTH